MGLKNAKIFLLYGCNDENLVNNIYNYFKDNYCIKLHRVKIDIETEKSIKEYIKSISEIDYAILLVSDSFLTSENCINEFLKVLKDKKYENKIFPVASSTKIFSSTEITKSKNISEEKYRVLTSPNLYNTGKHKNKKDNKDTFLNIIADKNNSQNIDVKTRIVDKLKEKGFLKKFNIITVGEGLGDCFFIEISNDYWETVVMIDGRDGKGNSYKQVKEKIEEYQNKGQGIDYLIVTHIDSDHINGINNILQLDEMDARKAFEKTVIIYNYVTKPVVNYEHALKFEECIVDNIVIPTCKNNYIPYSCPCLKILSLKKRQYFDPREQQGYKDCAYLTLVHPSDKIEINDVYNDYIKKTSKEKKQPDQELVNRHSIAFLLEYGDVVVLFTGDSSIEIIKNKIHNLKNMEDRKINLIKIPHHGSKDNNTGLVEFAQVHECSKFLVTGEKKWNKKHPSSDLVEELVNGIGDNMHIYTNVELNIYEEKIFRDTEIDMMGD
ncbi:TIR domain-containing protein [Clostridium estertheticum]|uniref:TIR domain-containing protein n=1 Tax=Clostridium estertheticum TaxID=238834 RepID=A0A7Y3SWB4_9CLOT|nr:hypothetical protein [Clostridium estertheticum]NNU76352.1 hypothetical protein [Clostridium estertheticum]WBL45843.1 hypothetical protein LOR37_14265 [Clostridium estertheticum]